MQTVNASIERAQRIDWQAALETLGLRVVGAIAIAVVGIWLVRWVVRGIDRVLTRANVEDISRLFLKNLAYAFLLVLVGFAVLQQLGVPPASLFAMLGAAGLAIGLALKDSLANIASGVLLIVQKPFHVGDVVQVGNFEGRVTQVRIFTTQLRTLDNRDIIIPNSVVTGQAILNLSRQPTRRLDIRASIGYGDDVQTAKQAMLSTALGNSSVLHEPSPEVIINGLSATGVDLDLRVWVNSQDVLKARSDLSQDIRNALTERGMSLGSGPTSVNVIRSGLGAAGE